MLRTLKYTLPTQVTELCPGGASATSALGSDATTAPLLDYEAPVRLLYPNARGVFEDILLCGSSTGTGTTPRLDAAPLVHRVQSIGYVLTEAPRPGALDAGRAAAFGVRGKDLGRLKAGEDVPGRHPGDGSPCVVRALDCVGAPTPGRRLLLLGDTCDSAGVLPLGRGFSAIVHESTFDDASAALALPRGHSTARMAGAFAAAAGAELLVLTHFSQVRVHRQCWQCFLRAVTRHDPPPSPLQRFRPGSKDAAAAAVMEGLVRQARDGHSEAVAASLGRGPGNTDACAAGAAPAPLAVVTAEDFSVIDLRLPAARARTGT